MIPYLILYFGAANKYFQEEIAACSDLEQAAVVLTYSFPAMLLILDRMNTFGQLAKASVSIT